MISNHLTKRVSYSTNLKNPPIVSWAGFIYTQPVNKKRKFLNTGKSLCPLITHGGSGFSNSLNDIQRLCPDARITKGLAINGDDVSTCDKDVEKWLKQIGLK